MNECPLAVWVITGWAKGILICRGAAWGAAVMQEAALLMGVRPMRVMLGCCW